MADLIDFEALFTAAAAHPGLAYAPYSRFKVGAALLADDGSVHAGCNVENAAYPVGACAEAGADIGDDRRRRRAIARSSSSAKGAELVTPCGACRQRIREFAAPDTPVAIAGPDGIRARFSLVELLPASFGANLEIIEAAICAGDLQVAMSANCLTFVQACDFGEQKAD
jgi:cytidine deaminase